MPLAQIRLFPVEAHLLLTGDVTRTVGAIRSVTFTTMAADVATFLAAAYAFARKVCAPGLSVLAFHAN